MNFRIHLGVFVGALAAVSCLQMPAKAFEEDLFPAKLGNTWTFKGTAGTVPLNMTATVTSSTTAKGKTTAVFKWTQNGQVNQTETYSISSTGVVREASGVGGGSVISPPLPVIKYPMKVGNSWKWKGTLKSATQTFDGVADLKVAAKETVKTEAGTFSAYKVDLDLTVTSNGKSLTIKNSYWYAAGAGMVKQAIDIPTPDGKTLTIQAATTSYKVNK
jgi:hypothetical protein